MADGPLRLAVLKSKRFAPSPGAANDGGSLNVVRMVTAAARSGMAVDVWTRREGRVRDDGGDPPPYRLFDVPWARSAAAGVLHRDHAEGAAFTAGLVADPRFAPPLADGFHAHHWSSVVDVDRWLPAAAPLVYTPHLLAHEKAEANGLALPPAVRETELRALARADAVIALSQAEADAVARISDRTAHVVPNGVAPELFEAPVAEPVTPGGVIRIGCVGRLCRQKGLDVLLDAAAWLVGAGLDVHVDIVGGPYGEPDYEADVRARAAAPPLTGRVTIHTGLRHPDVLRLLPTWHVYVQPSRYESQGIALVEAMAAGRVVVATDLPAIAGYVSSGANGVLVDRLDGRAFGAAIRAALAPSDVRRLGTAARDAAARFSWAAAEERTVAVLAQLLGAARQRRSRVARTVARRLRREATAVARRLATGDGVHAVLLAGSVARGTPHAGSDADVVALVDGPEPLRQRFSFARGAPVDVREVSLPALAAAARGDAGELAAYAAATGVPDALAVHSVLAAGERDGEWAHVLAAVERRRTQPEVAAALASAHAAAAHRALDEARAAAAEGDLADAHQTLRMASVASLLAVLVAAGWRARGAKRLPEIAAGYARDSTEVAAATLFLLDVTGARLDPAAAHRLARARLAARRTYVAHLEQTLPAGHPLVTAARRHAAGAVDYYGPLIDAGYVRGAVHHLRVASGLARIPDDIQAVSGLPGRPIRALQRHVGTGSPLWGEWSALMDLSADEVEVGAWLAAGERVLAPTAP